MNMMDSIGRVLGVILAFGVVSVYGHNVGDTPQKPDKPPCDKCEEDCPDRTCADPFYLHSGEFFWEKTFLRAPSSFLEFSVRYSTFSDTEGVLGAGWTHGYQYRAYPTEEGGYAVRVPLRKTIFFEFVSGTQYRAKENSPDQLWVEGSGLRMRSNNRDFVFDAQGRLTKIVNAAMGKQLAVSYDPAGPLPVMGIPRASRLEEAVVTARDWRVSRVDEQSLNGTPTGRSLDFAYDSNGHLWKVSEVGGTRFITLFFSMPMGQLTSISDELEQSSSFTYWDDPQTVRDSVENSVYWRYMKTFQGQGCSDCVIRTNYYTTADSFNYSEQRAKLRRQTEGASEQGQEVDVSYFTNNTTVTYKTKNTATGAILQQRVEKVVFVADVFGEQRVKSRTVHKDSSVGPVIYAVSFTYDSANARVKTETLENGSEITYTYDGSGNITKEERKVDGTGRLLITDRTYDANGYVDVEDLYFSDVPTVKFTTDWDHDSGGRVTAEKRKKADGSFVGVDYQYFTSGPNLGLLQTKTDARNNQLSYEYTDGTTGEPKGLVKRIYDPANPNRQTTYKYDAWGNKRFETDALIRETEYRYDAAGRVTTVITPDLTEEIRTYVGGNLREVKIGKASAGWRITRYQYNGLNQRIRALRVNDQGQEIMQWERDYDSDDNVIVERNALGQATNFTYDSVGRRTSAKEPRANGGIAETQFVPDAGGRIIKETSPLDIVTEMSYDLLDRLTLLIEAKGTPDERRTGYVYDAAGNQVQVQYLPSAGVTNYYYERTGWRTGVNWDPSSGTPDAGGRRELPKKMEYDNNGNLTAEVDGRNSRTEYVYNAYNELTTIKYADRANYTGGNDTVYGYDLVGNRISETDGRGNKRFFNHDAMNRVTHESLATTANLTGSWWTTPANVLRTRSYDAWGQPTGTANWAGGSTGATYDAYGRLYTQTAETGVTVTLIYNELDAVLEQRYPALPGNDSGTKIVTTYNAYNGRLPATMTDRANNLTTFGYDNANRQNVVTSSLNATTTTGFDNLGRVKTLAITVAGATDPSLSQTTSYTYNRFDDILTITFPDHVAGTNERVQTMTYNDYGFVLTQSGASTYPLEFTYDLAGNRETLKTKYGAGATVATTTWEYDSRNRPNKKIYPDNSDYQYTYDAAGNLYTRRDGKAVVTTYDYNAYNLLKKIDYPADPDVDFGYDAAGRRTSMTDATGLTEWVYYPSGLLNIYKQHGVDRMITYAYTAEGGRTTMSVERISTAGSPWTTSYTYDASGRMKTVVDSQTGTFTYTWKPNANLVTEILMPGGAKQVKTYDALERLGEIKALNAAAATVNRYAYSYDKANVRKDVTLASNAKITYGYDPTRQLTSAVSDTDTSYNYAYSFDPIGNWLSGKTGNLGGAPTSKTFTPNALNQYASVSGATHTYDLNGNLTNPGSYTWDQENRLINADGTGFSYDGMSRRVSTVGATNYLYDGMLPIAELGAAHAITRYVTRGLDLTNTREGAGGIGGILATKTGSSGGNYFYDGNGNVVQVLSSASAVLADYTYDPFGNKVSESGTYASQPYQWSTKELNAATGLVYYLYRFYSPVLGRWINRDPLEETGGENLYSFVENSPIMVADYYGLISTEYDCTTVRSTKKMEMPPFLNLLGFTCKGEAFYRGTISDCDRCCPGKGDVKELITTFQAGGSLKCESRNLLNSPLIRFANPIAITFISTVAELVAYGQFQPEGGYRHRVGGCEGGAEFSGCVSVRFSGGISLQSHRWTRPLLLGNRIYGRGEISYVWRLCGNEGGNGQGQVRGIVGYETSDGFANETVFTAELKF